MLWQTNMYTGIHCKNMKDTCLHILLKNKKLTNPEEFLTKRVWKIVI